MTVPFRSMPAITFAAALLLAAAAWAEDGKIVVTMHKVGVTGLGAKAGTITFSDGPYGLVIQPDLEGVPPGPHATHVHVNPDCGPSGSGAKVVVAGAAGGHLDPAKTGKDLGPYLEGSLGDLPNTFVESDGTATIPSVAPRLKLADLKGRSIMLHANPDRYAPLAGMPVKTPFDRENPGSGARILCGIVP